jgi:hypothetical protein
MPDILRFASHPVKRAPAPRAIKTQGTEASPPVSGRRGTGVGVGVSVGDGRGGGGGGGKGVSVGVGVSVTVGVRVGVSVGVGVRRLRRSRGKTGKGWLAGRHSTDEQPSDHYHPSHPPSYPTSGTQTLPEHGTPRIVSCICYIHLIISPI